MQRWLFGALFIGAATLLFLGSVGMVVAGFLFVVLAVLVVFGVMSMPLLRPAQGTVTVESVAPAHPEPQLPYVPRSLSELRGTHNDKTFEYFTAAILMALGQGLTFEACLGGSGDRGVDVRMRNMYNQLVFVQCKFNAPDNTVGSPEIRNFMGAIHSQQAAYGYFVTTATFTPAARVEISSNNGRIRGIDGMHIDYLLRWRRREIALAWQEIQDNHRLLS